MEPALLEPNVDAAPATGSETFNSEATGTGEITPIPEEGWLHDKIEELEKLLHLKENWNSYGAKVIDPRSVGFAKYFLNLVVKVNQKTLPPIVTASPEGNAAFCWEKSAKSLDIEIFPDESIKYVYLDEQNPSLEEEGSTKVRLAGRLILLLSKF